MAIRAGSPSATPMISWLTETARSGPRREKRGRNDSVSVKQPVGRFAAALERAFGPREKTPTNTATTGPSRSHQKEEVHDDSVAADGVWNRIGNSLERAFGRRREN